MGQAKLRGTLEERIAEAIPMRLRKLETVAWHINKMLDRDYPKYAEHRKKLFKKSMSRSEIVNRMLI